MPSRTSLTVGAVGGALMAALVALGATNIDLAATSPAAPVSTISNVGYADQ